MPTVRIRILAEAEGQAALRDLIDAALPGGDWPHPGYCYLDVKDVGLEESLPVPNASSLGGALSRLRAAVRRGARGLIVASRSSEAAMSVARRIPGVTWQSAVSGPGSDRMNLRLFGTLS